jgi:hypothetical protein
MTEKKKPTKRERLAKKAAVKEAKLAKIFAARKVVQTKLSKKQVALKNEFWSVKAYLYKKAQLRALKLQFREARRNAKKDGNLLTYSEYLASLQPAPAHEHVHGVDCDHDHEEPIVINEDDLSQPLPETTV